MSKVLPLLEELFRHQIGPALGMSDNEWPDLTKDITEHDIQKFHTRLALIGDKLNNEVFSKKIRRRCRICRSAKQAADAGRPIQDITYDIDPRPEWNGWELYKRYVQVGRDLPTLCTHCKAVIQREADKVEHGFGGYAMSDVPKHIRSSVESEIKWRGTKRERRKSKSAKVVFDVEQLPLSSTDSQAQAPASTDAERSEH